MKPSSLLRTKFLVPQPAADRMARPQLIEWLGDQMDKRLILLSAPPGYGKTTLLVDFLAAWSQPVAWLQLDEADNDPSSFLACLIEAVSHLPVGRRLAIWPAARALLENANPSTSPQQILTVLLNELSDAPFDHWLLVLEDYHYIASQAVHQLLDLLLENCPASLHVILSTRADPPIALPRLRARGMLAELRAASLRFSGDEITSFVQLTFPGLSESSLNVLVEKTEGWAAALQIVRSSLAGQDVEQADRFIAGLSGSHRFIFEYLLEEVFKRQGKKRQIFLLYTSILSQLDAAVCDTLPHIANARTMLDHLEQENLFITSLDAKRQWYRYHNLFREFLLSKLQHEQPDLVGPLHSTAARHFESLGELEVAFFHYTQAREWESAAKVIQAFAPAYVDLGKVDLLRRYLTDLPKATIHTYPELLLQRGNVYQRLGEAGLAVNDYEDARTVFQVASQPGGVSRALTHLAEMNRAQGYYRQAESLASEALASAPLEDHAARADALMALAKSSGFLAGMELGRSLAEQAVSEARLAEDQLSTISRANFLQSLGQICWWHGDPQATIQYCTQALSLIPGDLSPIATQACITLVSPYLYWRELDTALKYAERGLEIAQTLHLRELLPSAYSALGNVLTRYGETSRAENCLRQAMDLAQVLGFSSYERLMTAGYLALNLYQQNRVDEAQQIAESALWVYTGNPDTYEAFVCSSVLADIALEKGQLVRAEERYADLVEVGERRQFRIPLSMVYFGLAYIHLETYRQESGFEFARKALALIEPTQAIQLFIDQGERSRLVCNALLQAGEQSPFLQRVLASLPTDSAPLPRLEVNQAAVVVKTLGSFRVYLGGEEISQDRWISTKARDLLAYFVTFRGEHIPGERIFDAIWSDKPSRGMTAFHTALSRLRHALRKSDTSPRFILVETGEYWLDMSGFSLDVNEFDTALTKARAAVNHEQAAHWFTQAIDLYHGEYLDNLYYEWILPERQRLNQAYIATLRALSDHHFNGERYTNALELLQRALRLDNLNEEMHCQAMRTYAALGDQVGLAHQYQELERLLAEEMGMQPLLSTRKQYQRLVGDISK